MKHYGDITKIDGHKVEIVDVVCGGSPCQDLSVAGKRAGLAGERSGLFMEQIRIIKEMREHDRELHGDRADEFIRPRYMVWENVPGALSSKNGADFAAVLEETLKIVCQDAHVDVPERGWPHSGCIFGENGGCPWLGEYTMRSFGECPKEGVESLLSQILEDSAHPKYYLSAKACRGILTRAERRGKRLPEILKEALQNQIQLEECNAADQSR